METAEFFKMDKNLTTYYFDQKRFLCSCSGSTEEQRYSLLNALEKEYTKNKFLILDECYKKQGGRDLLTSSKKLKIENVLD